MELESKKYKTRLIIMLVILIIASIIANITQQVVQKDSESIDETIQLVQSIPKEEYEEKLNQLKNTGADIELYKSKEDALEQMQKVQDTYDSITKYPRMVQVMLLTLSYSGPIIALVVYFILTGALIRKNLPEIKQWLSIIMRILVLIRLSPILIFVFIVAGTFGQIPYAAYTLYKYIKNQKEENEGDIITDKNTKEEKNK